MADPLLDYAITTEPSPLQASSPGDPPIVCSLVVVVSNPHSAAVQLDGVIVRVPAGPDADHLTEQLAAITLAAPPGWEGSPIQGKFGFYPEGGPVQVAGQGLAFKLDEIAVNEQPGTVHLQVMELSNGALPPTAPFTTIALAKFPFGLG